MSKKAKLNSLERSVPVGDPEAETNGAQVDEPGGETPAAAPRVPLEDAARRLMDELDPDHQRVLSDCVMETGQPLSAYILSALRLSRDRGEVSKLDRESLVEPEYAAPAATVQCDWCKTWFTPTRPGQYLCPEPLEGQESCAHQMAMDRVRRRRTRDEALGERWSAAESRS